MIDEVREHIKKFPVIESHYCRENTKRKYLEEGLSIGKMYKLYIEEKKPVQEQDNNKDDVNENINVDEHANESKPEDEEDDEDESEVLGEEQKESQGREENIIDKAISKCKQKDVIHKNVVRLHKYTEIFNLDFNYGFFKPKKDR